MDIWQDIIFAFAFACNAKNFAIGFFSLSLSFAISSLLLDELLKIFLRTFYHLLLTKLVTKTGLISLETLKKVSVKIVP